MFVVSYFFSTMLMLLIFVATLNRLSEFDKTIGTRVFAISNFSSYSLTK